jgi:hypothetical protein
MNPAGAPVLQAHPPAAALSCCTTAILNNAYPSNWYSGAWSYDSPDQATFTVKCNWVPGAYPSQGSCWLWKVQYGSYQVSSGCEPSKAKPVYQQTENLCFNDRVGGPWRVACLTAVLLCAGQLDNWRCIVAVHATLLGFRGWSEGCQLQ